ncbi:MAG: hydroxyacid dehydrogenase [Cupriavidus sp.]|nr:hydroxyacid dehydrogenase [Cupriavidus sp.]
MNASGYAAYSPVEPMRPFSFSRREPRQDDVAIEILYTGVCHTDLHAVRNHKGRTTYPLVPGHEIVGRVTQVGPDVTRFKVGDLVGVGCMVDSCHHCAACDSGQEQHCLNGATYTYDSIDRQDGTRTYGGYSDRIVVSDRFVLKAPENLDLAGVAPLLCAGITTWSPLRRWNIGKGSRVAVVGLGGLGHMALKLAKALGADVTLFSRSPGKEQDALRLGAHRVVISEDAEQMAALAGQFDLIVDTVPYTHDLNPYLPTLAYQGTMVLVGLIGPLEEQLSTVPLVFGGRALAGSFIGGIPETQEMLDFCGEHGITSDVEIIRMQEIDNAFDRLLKSDVKYRFVIDMASLKDQ